MKLTLELLDEISNALYKFAGKVEGLEFISFKEYSTALHGKIGIYEEFRDDKFNLIYRVKYDGTSFYVDFLPLNDSFKVTDLLNVISQLQLLEQQEEITT